MKALIFAAGLGTRLRPLTLTIPKALAPVAGKPILGRVIDKLKLQGVDEFVINLHHFPDKIRRYIAAEYHDLNVCFSDESSVLLDTGGGILAARRFLDGSEPFIVHNADILTFFDIAAMVEAHRSSGADATLLTSSRQSSRRLMFCHGQLCGWLNTSDGSTIPENVDFVSAEPASFGGVHIISPSIFPALESYGKKVFSITPFYASYADRLNIRSYSPPEPFPWFDIGTAEKLRAASDFIESMQ